MPPRYAYWTILIDNTPTAFRAKEQSELLPTVHQLRRTNKDVVMKWFANGRVWDSPEAAREARHARTEGERRGKDWRPGGQHKDPRARFSKPKKDRPSVDRPERPTSDRQARPARPPSDRERKPWQTKPMSGRPDTSAKPWQKPPVKPWDKGPRKPWQDRPGKASGGDRRPWQDKPPSAARGPRPDGERGDRWSRPPQDRSANAPGGKPGGWRPKPFGATAPRDRGQPRPPGSPYKPPYRSKAFTWE